MNNTERIVIVGVGGTGSYLIQPLARYLNAERWEGLLFIIDGDKYEASNIGRQEFPSSMLGENKAVAHMQVIRARFPDVKVIAHEGYLGDDNKSSLIIEKSIVFGCVDNHFARKLICERGAELNDFAFISAGNEMTDGNVNLYLRKDGKDITPPLWMLHPEISRDKGGDRSAMSCEEIAAMPGGGQVIFTNLMAASLSLAMFWNLSRNPETREILFDINKVKTRSIQI